MDCQRLAAMAEAIRILVHYQEVVITVPTTIIIASRQNYFTHHFGILDIIKSFASYILNSDTHILAAIVSTCFVVVANIHILVASIHMFARIHSLHLTGSINNNSVLHTFLAIIKTIHSTATAFRPIDCTYSSSQLSVKVSFTITIIIMATALEAAKLVHHRQNQVGL